MFAFRLMRYVDLYTTQLDNLIDVPLAHKYFPAVYSFCLFSSSNRECLCLMNHLVVISNILFAFIWIVSTKKIHNCFLLFCFFIINKQSLKKTTTIKTTNKGTSWLEEHLQSFHHSLPHHLYTHQE